MQGLVSVAKGEPKSRKLPPCPQFLSLSFPASSVYRGVLVPLSDFCFHLFSSLFLLPQTLQQTLVLILTLEYRLASPTLSSLCFLWLFYFSSHSGHLEAWLRLLPAFLSVRFS